MRIYSENIFSFIYKCEDHMKKIINAETPFRFAKSRIHINNMMYPLKIIIFPHSGQLGFFCAESFKIGLNECLMYQAKEHVLKNIIRHELAHFFCHVLYENQDRPHGMIFKQLCLQYKWDQAVSKASMNIDMENNRYVGNLDSEKLIIKIKNLLKLAESDNEHEASLATLKANQLLLKHNLKNIKLDNSLTYVDTVYESKRYNSKMSSIYKILEHFMVRPIIVYKTNSVTIEVTGKKENIELASYLAGFLDMEFERLWFSKKHLKGLRAKNSFFTGIALGFCEKLNLAKNSFSEEESKSLTKISNDLSLIHKKIHQGMSNFGSSRTNDHNALINGKEAGKNLNINPAIKSNKKEKSHLLSWNQ